MMEYPKFCYKYVAQPSLYKRTEFCLRFLLAFFAKLKSHQNAPNLRLCLIVTGFSLFVCPHLLLHFTPKIDLIIEMFHP